MTMMEEEYSEDNLDRFTARQIEEGDDEDREEDRDEENEEPKQKRQKLVRTLANKDIRTLEDLYSMYPKLTDGSGEYFIRIFRNLPRMWRDPNNPSKSIVIQGKLGDYATPPNDEDIRKIWGGGQYNIIVMGRVPHGDRDYTRSFKSFKLQLPGDPVPHILATELQTAVANEDVVVEESEQKTMNHNPAVPISPPLIPVTSVQHAGGRETPTPAAVAVKQLEVQERREMRQEERQAQELTQMTALSRQTMEQMVAQQRDTAEQHRKQVLELQAELREKEKSLRALQADQVKFQTDARLNESIAHDAKTKFETLEKEYQRLRDEHRNFSDIAERRYREQIEEVRRNAENEKRRQDEFHNSERERIREEHRNREKDRSDEYERRLSAMREAHDARLSDIMRANEREIASIKESRDLERRSLETQAKVEVGAIRNTAETRAQLAETERARLQAEVDRLHRELKTYQKDPATFIRETQEIATNLLGMVPAGAQEEAPEDDWKKMAARGLFGVLEKAPEIVQQVGVMRQQGRQMVAQQQQAQRMAQRPPIMQQHAQARMMRGPNGVMAPIQSARGGAPGPAFGPMQAVPPPPPMPSQMQSAMVPTMPPEQPPHQSSFQSSFQSQSSGQQQVQHQQGQQTPSTAPAPLTSVPPPAADVTPEQLEGLQQLLGALDNAIKEKVISPKQFAQFVVAQAGPEAISHALQRIQSPDDLFEFLESRDIDVSITTRDGKKYTREAWDAIRSLVNLPSVE